MSLRHHAALRISFLSIAAVTGAGGAGHRVTQMSHAVVVISVLINAII